MQGPRFPVAQPGLQQPGFAPRPGIQPGAQPGAPPPPRAQQPEQQGQQPGQQGQQPGQQGQQGGARGPSPGGLTILIWNWNADGIRLCSSLAQPEENREREGFWAFVTRKKDCLVPDFFEPLMAHIRARKADIVVFTTQEEPVSGTYLHSDFLQERMPEVGYVLVGRVVQDGVGEVASGRSLGRDQEAEGSLRISVYVRRSLDTEFTLMQGAAPSPPRAECRAEGSGRVSGMVGLYMTSTTYGRIAFLNVQLPDGNVNFRDSRKRAQAAASNQLCLTSMLDRLVFDLDAANSRPDYVFLIGDLNSHVFIPDSTPSDAASGILTNPSKTNIRNYLKFDELGKLKSQEPLVSLNIKEGVGDSGPVFPPTYPMVRGHPSECAPSKVEEPVRLAPTQCYSYVAKTPIFPSWRERILYGDIGDKDWNLVCAEYTRVDYGTTVNESSHLSILGTFYLTTSS